MVNDIIKIIDRIISLLKYRKEQKKIIFSDHVEPMFSAMEKIHNDYLISITALMNEFHKNPDIESLASSLKNKKVELEHIRVKTNALLKEGLKQEKGDESFIEFLESCVTYFCAQPESLGNHYIGAFPQLSRKISYIKDGGLSADEVKSQIPKIMLTSQEYIRRHWERVVQSYSKCKFEMI
jgi:hypothetical protein